MTKGAFKVHLDKQYLHLDGMRMKILIIDDEIAALTKMKALLSTYGECSMATNSNQAIQLCTKALEAQTPFNLITIDINLASESGLDILETLNNLEQQAKIPQSKKIMVTASGTKENLLKAYVKGCDGFWVKPIKRDMLEEKMIALGLAKALA
jgi:CheY-like chemotaxis protein